MKTRKTDLILPLVLGLLLAYVIGIAIYISRNNFTLQENGSVGDAINGLVAPVISIVAAVLVYISFRAQIRANELLQNQWTLDLLLKILSDISHSLNQIKIERYVHLPSGPKNDTSYGTEALALLAAGKWSDLIGVNNALVELQKVLYEFNFLLDRIITLESEEKLYIVTKVDSFYQFSLEGPLKRIEKEILEKKNEKYSYLLMQIYLMGAKIREISNVEVTTL